MKSIEIRIWGPKTDDFDEICDAIHDTIVELAGEQYPEGVLKYYFRLATIAPGSSEAQYDVVVVGEEHWVNTIYDNWEIAND